MDGLSENDPLQNVKTPIDSAADSDPSKASEHMQKPKIEIGSNGARSELPGVEEGSPSPLSEISPNVHDTNTHDASGPDDKFTNDGSSLGKETSSTPKEPGPTQMNQDDHEHKDDSNGSGLSTSKIPKLTITEPDHPKTTSKTFQLKPKKSRTNLYSSDKPASIDSDLENILELKHALNMSMREKTVERENRMSRLYNRGDWATLGRTKSTRTYFLAANLSGESDYAIDTAIGQTLRDGDTLVVMFAIDKDTDISLLKRLEKDGMTSKPQNAKVDESAEKQDPGSRKSSVFGNMRRYMTSSSRRSSEEIETQQSKRARIRGQALNHLSAVCIQRVRKTRLHIRIVVEIIHCKDASRMLIEAIDILQPVLAIVGSRGRSVVEGIIRGSFSRRLIMESSVPVMIARKKKSPLAPEKQPEIKMQNDLKTAKSVLDNDHKSKKQLKALGHGEGLALKRSIQKEEEEEEEEEGGEAEASNASGESLGVQD